MRGHQGVLTSPDTRSLTVDSRLNLPFLVMSWYVPEASLPMSGHNTVSLWSPTGIQPNTGDASLERFNRHHG
jgi:hypothetical protein